MAVRQAAQPGSRANGGRWPSDAVLVGILTAVAILAYCLLARLRIGPIVDNDEYLYGNLAQSIAAGDGAVWHGVDTGTTSLYPYVIAPAWSLGDGETALRMAQGIGVLFCTTAVSAVWLVSRHITRARWALVAPVLVTIGIWMELGTKLMTEAVAFPLVVWGLALLALSLWKRDWRLFAGAAGLALLAALIRPQAGALAVVLPVALAAEVVRRPREDRPGALRALRGHAVVAALAVIALVFAVTAGRSMLGSYAGVLDTSPSLWASVRWSADHGAEVALMCGLVAWLGFVALALDRRSWRDPSLGPFLAVAVPSVAVFVLLAGVFTAGESPRVIERYVAYVGPLVVIALVPALERASAARLAAGSIVTVALLALGHKPALLGGEAPALEGYGADLFGWSDPSASMVPIAVLVLAAGAVLAGAAWACARDERWRRWLIVVGVAAAAVGLLLPSRHQWAFDHKASGARRDVFGAVPDGIAIPGKQRATLVSYNVAPPYVLWIEFFNKRIDRAIVQPAPQAGAGYGPTCRFDLSDDGSFVVGDRCTSGSRAYVWMGTPPTIPTLRGGGPARPAGVRYAYVVSGQPRLLALRQPLCDDLSASCRPAKITTFTARRGVMTFRFRGGQSAHRIAVNQRVRAIPAGATRDFTVPVGEGRTETSLQPDWQVLSADVPVLESVVLAEAGERPVTVN